ncbi:MAG: hypothetical protein IT257_05030, partial [Chitinophagaceae bacterium]|nr:hypothetical protein [Chitinophagaceae bacterium]
FTFKFFRDCAGSPAPQSLTMCCENQCGAVAQMITLNLDVPIGAVLPNGHIQGAAVASGCAGATNTCNGGNLPGYQEYWYSATYTIPSQCNSWHFWVFNCCRNGSIGNIDNPAATSFFVETTYDNTNNQNFNTSPDFLQTLLPYVCVNVPVIYNNGAYDLNGDSLTYEIIEPRSQMSCGVFAPVNILSPAFNIANNPFPTNNTFYIDPATGMTTFTPSVTGVYVITVKVNEYRSGNLIGHILREVQFVVGNCALTQPTFTLDTLNISGGYYNNDQIKTCVGDSLHACFQIQSGNALASLQVNDNAPLAIPGASIAYTGTGSNLVNACITWAPNAGNAGLHSLIIHTIDSSCVTQAQFANRTDTVLIQVNNLNITPAISITANTNTAATGFPLTFTATTNVTPGFTIQWYANNNLSYSSSDTFWNTTMTPGNLLVYAVIKGLSSCFSPDSAVSNNTIITNTGTGISDFQHSNVKIYPSPVQAILYIDGVQTGDVIKVIDQMGNKMSISTAQSNKVQIMTEKFPKGIYSIIILHKSNYRFLKFEKM